MIADIVDRVAVALGPSTIFLTNPVEARDIVIRRLKILGLVKLIAVSELDLVELLLRRRSANAGHFRGIARITYHDRRATKAGPTASKEGWLGSNRDWLGHRIHDRLAIDHHAVLRPHEGLLYEGGLLIDNVARLLCHSHATKGWLLQRLLAFGFMTTWF